MNSVIVNLKKLPLWLAHPFIITSLILLLSGILHLINLEEINYANEYLTENMNLIFLVLSSFYISYNSTNNSKKSMIVTISLLICDLIFLSMSGSQYSLVFIIIISFLYSSLVKKFEFYSASISLIMISFTVSVLFGLCSDVLTEMLEYYAKIITGKPLLYGLIEPIYSLLFSDNFSELFLFKGYSQTLYINDKLVSGAINIFKADIENPASVVSKYLTGKYYLNLFVTSGIFVSLYSRFNDFAKSALCFTAALCVIFGRFELFLLFIFIFNPVIIIGYMFLSAVSYLVPILMDIRIGYTDSASLIELIKNANNVVYFLVSGLIIAVLSYFVINIINSRFDLQNSKILPKEVRILIKGLGGKNNIDRIKNDKLYVKNPNLIDILSVDCEIHENEITLLYDDLNMLKNYF